MVHYERLYAILCAAASEALDALPDTKENAEGRLLLQTALFQAEELYISQTDNDEA